MSFSVTGGTVTIQSRDFKCLLSKVLRGPHVQWSLAARVSDGSKVSRVPREPSARKAGAPQNRQRIDIFPPISSVTRW